MKPIDPSQLSPVGLSAVMADLEPILAHLGLDFYIVGAVARDIWLAQQGARPHRMTTDLDLAVYIADETQYDGLITSLLQTENFTSIRSSAFAVHHSPTRTTVDLMPFGAIAALGGTVCIKGGATEEISTVGFLEMAEDAVAVPVEGAGTTWRVASLPALLLLKLVAWEDRPEWRGKDATDIALVLRYYYELAGDRVYDQHADLLDDPEADDLAYRYGIAAHIAGRELRQLLADSAVLPRIRALLHRQVEAGPAAPFVVAMKQGSTQNMAGMQQIFKRFVKGFFEK